MKFKKAIQFTVPAGRSCQIVLRRDWVPGTDELEDSLRVRCEGLGNGTYARACAKGIRFYTRFPDLAEHKSSIY